MEFIKHYLENLYTLFIDMSFYMVIGLIFTGLLHSFVNKTWITKQVGKKGIGSVVKASLIGVPLPLCSCGVVPTGIELGKNGATRGAVTSFLTSTPQTGVDSIIATYGMMGGFFAFFRAIAAFISGIITGFFTDIFVKDEKILSVHTSCGCHASIDTPEETHEETHSCCCHETTEVPEETHACCCHETTEVPQETHSCCCHETTEVPEETHACCCHETTEVPEETHACCCHETTKVPEEAHDCGCGCGSSSVPVNANFITKLKEAFTYAFSGFLSEIARHFIVGLLIAALISTFIPTNSLAQFSGTILPLFAMLVIGIPMYVCSTSSIPIAVSLISTGLTPGAAFVFLFSGPVTNIASLSILVKSLGKKTVGIYLVCVSVCALLFGILLDLLPISMTNLSAAHMCHSEPSILVQIVAVVFLLCLIRSIYISQKTKRS